MVKLPSIATDCSPLMTIHEADAKRYPGPNEGTPAADLVNGYASHYGFLHWISSGLLVRCEDDPAEPRGHEVRDFSLLLNSNHDCTGLILHFYAGLTSTSGIFASVRRPVKM